MKKDRCLRLYAILVIFISISFSGCGDDDSPRSLRVRVVNADGKEIAGSTVVLGNPDGSMVTYGTTDATGIIYFQYPPNNATVSAAIDCEASSYHYYSLTAGYDALISPR